MDLAQLREYKQWINKSPQDILLLVFRYGGWNQVFQNGLPPWAHQVRNYFNATPRRLLRVNTDTAGAMLKGAKKFEFLMDCAEALKQKRAQESNWITFRPAKVPDGCPASAENLPKPDFTQSLAITGALSGDVYKDDEGRTWFQMSPGGSIYHHGTPPTDPKWAAAMATVHGQVNCPIFKLVSPDGTGGSCECIIQNPESVTWKSLRDRDIRQARRATTIGDHIDEFVDVSNRIITDRRYIGTYNYAETTQAGYAKHEEYDMAPHMKAPDAYLEPPPETSLHSRRFPATAGGKELGK